MSILSKLNVFKKNETSPKADEEATNPKTQPYRHIPTHAASDALSQGPPGATAEADKRAIRKQRRQHGEMSRQISNLSTETTVDRSNGSTSDSLTTTTTDQGRVLPVFQNIIVSPPKKTMQEGTPQTSADLGSDKFSSTASSSTGGSSFLEIPPRNPRRSKHVSVANQHWPITQIPEHRPAVEAADVKTSCATTVVQARKQKKPLAAQRRRTSLYTAPNQPPPVPQLPERLAAVKIPDAKDTTAHPPHLRVQTVMEQSAAARPVIDFSKPRPCPQTPTQRPRGLAVAGRPIRRRITQTQAVETVEQEREDASATILQDAEGWPRAAPEPQVDNGWFDSGRRGSEQ